LGVAGVCFLLSCTCVGLLGGLVIVGVH
jgi:hypothetical protein